MKPLVIFLAATLLGLAPGAARAQGASMVYDEAVFNSTNQIKAILERQLAEAEKQTQKLQDQLSRMGDPRSVNLDSIAMIREDVQKTATALKTESEQRTVMSTLTGAEVFDDDAFGLMQPIGATVTKTDGTVVDRDPEKYKLEAAMKVGVKEYQEVREKALERKQLLSEELSRVIEQLGSAQDFATVQKLQTMVTVLRGQMEECNHEIQIARADADMLEKDLTNTARVVQKGKQEEMIMKNQGEEGATPKANPVALENFKKTMKSPGKLPWGKKGTEGNPGTAGGGTSTVP